MQKNEAGFKMAFKKRNPEFKKPPKKISASIPATGDLRRHDQPTRAMKSSHDSSSSSDEDILEQKRKEEIENQKTEQAKLVEMALLEQVMSGQLDVLKLLKSGEIENSSSKEKIQKQMLLDGIPTQPPAPGTEQCAPAHGKQAPLNPLLRNRDPNAPVEEPSHSKQKKKRVKSSGSISSESSESSSLSDSDISTESDSDEDSHKLIKKVKKLKSKNKKLRKKVKLLKKKLKEKKVDKTDSSNSSVVKRNSHGQIIDSTKSQPPQLPQPQQQLPHPQQTGVPSAPMTPQQFAALQTQMRRVYDPQTGQYRMGQDFPANVPGMQAAAPALIHPPSMPLGQMPTMPFGLMPTMPPKQMPFLAPPTTLGIPQSFAPVKHDPDIQEVKAILQATVDPMKNFLTDDDLYMDVFKGKEKPKPKPLLQSNPSRMANSRDPQHISTVITTQRQITVSVPPMKPYPKNFVQQNVLQQNFIQQNVTQHAPVQSTPQPVQSAPVQQPAHQASSDTKERSRTHSNSSTHSSAKESGKKKKSNNKRSNSHDRNDSHERSGSREKSEKKPKTKVRNEVAKELIQDFYEDQELEILEEDRDVKLKKINNCIYCGVNMPTSCATASSCMQCYTKGKHGQEEKRNCIYCEAFIGGSYACNCYKGNLYLKRLKEDEKRKKPLMATIKSIQDELVQIKNKRNLMMKIIVENDVRKKDRAEKMQSYRTYIDGLPEPVRVSQEFGRKVVEASTQNRNLEHQLEHAIKKGRQLDDATNKGRSGIRADSPPVKNPKTDDILSPAIEQPRRRIERPPAEHPDQWRETEQPIRRRFEGSPVPEQPVQRRHEGAPIPEQPRRRIERPPAEHHDQRKQGRPQYFEEEMVYERPPPRQHERSPPPPPRQRSPPPPPRGQPRQQQRPSPGPPPRSIQRPGLLQTPAAGPPQRPPPIGMALLKTPDLISKAPGYRDADDTDRIRPQDRLGPRLGPPPADMKRFRPRVEVEDDPAPHHGWSGERGR